MWKGQFQQNPKLPHMTCQEKSTSTPSRMNFSDCLCNSGTKSGVGTSEGQCIDGLPGKYKATQGSALCTSCPKNAASLAVSELLNDCYCPIGYFDPTGSPYEDEFSSTVACFPVLSVSSLSLSLSRYATYPCTCACARALSLFILSCVDACVMRSFWRLHLFLFYPPLFIVILAICRTTHVLVCWLRHKRGHRNQKVHAPIRSGKCRQAH